ncbi:TPA: pheST operon leader peptide PheM [Providencia alcalifaciens]|uniref:pheST attenuator peptide n=2 Tax=Providencia TaxID=586 RepID=A0AAW9VIN9_9GAMM|nr:MULTISPECIES: pheST operon leader peptide PheM [Providencia]MTC75467.1 pheST operon leader peptide PheM [Providencia sp. wls1919]MBC5790103.1 pheST operon leader peptide PheM [Providencia sp. JUb39]MBF0690428.1 pheST operon leader peptide PheM [Providencia alcalifaciens]MBG5881854.1 pheST operon leader peptide PheM [Providencia alcalifaciens]MBS0924601.1 pheST operon leader peptide PheM [Providencia sp. JGM181]
MNNVIFRFFFYFST